MTINFNAKINPYINSASYNTNPQQPSVRKNFAATQYNTNQPRTASDFGQENFTGGYNLKAQYLDVLA